jgi:outer membrane protein TolC
MPVIARPDSASFAQTAPDTTLLANHPLLAINRAEINFLSAHKRLAEKERYPMIGLGIEFMDVNPGMSANLDGNTGRPIMLQLMLDVPLWLGKYRAATAAAQYRQAAAAHRQSEVLNDLSAKMARALYELRQSRRRIGLYEQSLIPRSRQSMAVSKAAFESGNATFLDFIDAQRTALDFELGLLQAVIDGNKARARLAELTGM